MTPEVLLKLIQLLLVAEPAVVQAIHNLMTGTGTTDDLAILKSDAIGWQAIADKAQAEIDKIKALPVDPPPTQ